LNVQPHRVDVTRVERPTTLAAFNQRNPSVIPVAELARLNQLPGPDAQLESGSLVKRVVEGTATMAGGGR
jgi:hypothetical protein